MRTWHTNDQLLKDAAHPAQRCRDESPRVQAFKGAYQLIANFPGLIPGWESSCMPSHSLRTHDPCLPFSVRMRATSQTKKMRNKKAQINNTNYHTLDRTDKQKEGWQQALAPKQQNRSVSVFHQKIIHTLLSTTSIKVWLGLGACAYLGYGWRLRPRVGGMGREPRARAGLSLSYLKLSLEFRNNEIIDLICN